MHCFLEDCTIFSKEDIQSRWNMLKPDSCFSIIRSVRDLNIHAYLQSGTVELMGYHLPLMVIITEMVLVNQPVVLMLYPLVN